MSAPRRDITGQRFGKLTALSHAGHVGKYLAKWLCRCECGKEKVIYLRALISGDTKSCGCILRTQAGLSKREFYTYASWAGMIRRCESKVHKWYKHYGAKGITVYFDWLGDQGFAHFVRDMGLRPVNMTLDRIDPSGNYEPGQCRWADAYTQRVNQMRMKKIAKEKYL